MLKSFGTWLGIENENDQVKQERESTVDANEDTEPVMNKPPDSEQGAADRDKARPPQLLQKAQGFSGRYDSTAEGVVSNLSVMFVILVSC